LDKSDNVNVYDYRISHNPGTGFRFRVGSGSAYIDSGAVSANTWHTVIAWHDHDSVNSTINIQVDDGSVNTLSYSGGTADSNNSLSIGAFPGGGTGLDGRIDEVAIYRNRVLTTSERDWIYNNGVGRTYADLTAPSLGSPINYTYDPNHKHAVYTLSTGESYGYDANGNMISRIETGLSYTQTFDTQNRLTAVLVGPSGQTTQFLYDPDGNLVTKIKPDGSKTIYVGGIYEEDKTSGGTVTQTRTYYPAGGAMRIGSTLYYVLKDHLGSASVLTDAIGALVTGADVRYLPFGEARSSTAPMLTDKLFTGQRLMADLGIYHYGARFYSPKLGRFLSADTIVPGYNNPQNLNRYTYALNNPLGYIDPSGHRACNLVNSGECDDTEENVIQLLDYVENWILNDRKDKIRGKYTSLSAMGKVVEKAAYIFGNDWNGFLDATTYVFTGYLGHGGEAMAAAGLFTDFVGYFDGASGFHPDFVDESNQVRHFWAAFATAADPYGDNPAGEAMAHIGNIEHDLIEDWLGFKDSTIMDYKLSLTGIDIARQVGRGKEIQTPGNLAPILLYRLGISGPGYIGGPIDPGWWRSPLR
jgi:RHS repeat-associated protein